MVSSDRLGEAEILEFLRRPAHELPDHLSYWLRRRASARAIVGALNRARSEDEVRYLVGALNLWNPPPRLAVPVLIRLLGCGGAETRHRVADLLGKIRSPAAGMAMLDRLREERSPRVRGMLFAGIGAAKTAGALSVLARGLQASSWQERQGAAWGLGALGDRAAIELVEKALHSERDPYVSTTLEESRSRLDGTPSTS